MPRKEDGGLDWQKITKVKVMGVEIPLAEIKGSSFQSNHAVHPIFFLTKNEYLLNFPSLISQVGKDLSLKERG